MAPIKKGEAGYSANLDADGDGIACESGESTGGSGSSTGGSATGGGGTVGGGTVGGGSAVRWAAPAPSPPPAPTSRL